MVNEIVLEYKESWILSHILKRGGGYFFGDGNLRNHAYYIWAIFNAVMYDKAIGGCIRGYILFEFKF